MAIDKNDSEMFHRRALLKAATLGGGAAVAQLFSGAGTAAAAERESVAGRGMPSPKIKDIIFIEVGVPDYPECAIIKVITDQPGLYGYGCATLTRPGGRSKLVGGMVADYLKPMVVGRPADSIDFIWQLAWMSSYYKNDNIQNAAIGGLTDALWDIKGRMANMPVYQLAGGKQRDAAEYYLHTGGKDLIGGVQKQMAETRCRNYLLSLGPQMGATNTAFGQLKFDDGVIAYDQDKATRATLADFELFRKSLPPELGLMIDVHSALDPVRATQYAKDCEQFKMVYVEDLLTAKDESHYKIIRALASTPLSIGEVWNNPAEWQPLVEQQLIDYIRCHVSHIGGFSAARKVAALADAYAVRFAWHASPNSPVGHMTNLTLDLTQSNFGIHEHVPYPKIIQDIFKGHLETRNGFAWVSEMPGWGMEIDEALAAKYPLKLEHPNEVRTPDGAIRDGDG
jgi:mannonate dehydratase